MIPRVQTENIERETLSSFAVLSSESKGRVVDEKKCDIRTDFQRDRDRIIYSKAFRRLKYKTQFFLAPFGDHYRTRLTHTLEVTQIARTIARALRLNEDLTEAIALGHDLGHAPFGHAGERALQSICPHGFQHDMQSLRVVEKLERRRGLNLTQEVLDGIVNHRTGSNPSTLEGKIVRISDKVAYINHDIDDSIRAGILSEEDLPKSIVDLLGRSSKERINNLVVNIIRMSSNENHIILDKEFEKALSDLKEYMFVNLYMNDYAKEEEEKVHLIIKKLYSYYVDNFEVLLEDEDILFEDDINRAVCDYVAGMSDRFAIDKFKEIFLPEGKH